MATSSLSKPPRFTAVDAAVPTGLPRRRTHTCWGPKKLPEQLGAVGKVTSQPADGETQGPAHRLTRRRGGAGLGGVTSLVGGVTRRRRKLAVPGRWQNQESGFSRTPERVAGRRRVAKPGARKPLLSLTQRLGTKQPPSAQRRARSDPRRSLRSPSAPQLRPSPPPSSWPWSVRTSAPASASPRTQPSSPTAPRRPGAAAVSAAPGLAGRAPEVPALVRALPSKGCGRVAHGLGGGCGERAGRAGMRGRGAAGAAAAPLFRAARRPGRLRKGPRGPEASAQRSG